MRRAWLALCGLLVGCARPDELAIPFHERDPWSFGTEVAPEIADDVVRFAAVGDMGARDEIQAVIAQGVHRACDDRCDFVLLLGDNFYETGVRDEQDEQETEHPETGASPHGLGISCGHSERRAP